MEAVVAKAGRNAGPGRPRRAETDELILGAAVQLLREQGPSAVNIDAVATRSGVARTTIYRRYRCRGELMTAVLDEMVTTELPAPTLPVPEKLAWLLQSILTVHEEGIGRGGTAALLTDSDPDFTQALRDRMAARLSVLERVMAQDAAEGRLLDGVDADTLVGLLFGAYLAEVLRYGELRPGWADRTVRLLAPAVTG